MQDSRAAGPSQEDSIVVPSRSDPLLAAMVEPVGGPLGRRTEPGRSGPGFFTVDRVLVIMAAVSALLAVVAKNHCRVSGWTTPDQYSTVCWSQFPNSIPTGWPGSWFPFVSTGSTFDGSPVSGFVAGVAAWLTGFAGSGTARTLAFFDANALMVAAVWIFTVVVVARTAGRRPWDAAMVAASPLLLLTAFVSWDFWAAALVGLGVLLFVRRNTLWAGLVLGVAAMAAPYAILVLLAVLVLGIRTRQATAALETLAAGVVGWLLVLAPVMALDGSAWRQYMGGFLSGTATESSIYGGWNLLAARIGLPGLDGGAVNGLAAALLVLVVLGVVALGLYSPVRPSLVELSAVAVAGLLVVDKFAQPWHAVWLLPLLALALPRWRPVLLWQAAVAVHFIALMLFQSKVLGNISDQHAIDTPYFVLASALAGAASCALAALLVRGLLQPRHGLPRRGGARHG